MTFNEEKDITAVEVLVGEGEGAQVEAVGYRPGAPAACSSSGWSAERRWGRDRRVAAGRLPVAAKYRGSA